MLRQILHVKIYKNARSDTFHTTYLDVAVIVGLHINVLHVSGTGMGHGCLQAKTRSRGLLSIHIIITFLTLIIQDLLHLKFPKNSLEGSHFCKDLYCSVVSYPRTDLFLSLSCNLFVFVAVWWIQY